MAEANDITIISKSHGSDEKSLETHLREENLKQQAKDARDFFSNIQDELDQRTEDFKDGLSFLDLKNDTLLSYMIDVCNVVLKQVRGESISGNPSVDRCIEYRVILEKIKSIDQNLAYQLNKLITMPEGATNFDEQRVNIKNLDIDLEGLESNNEESDGSESEAAEGEADNQDVDEDDEIDSDEADGIENSDEDGKEYEEDDDEEALKESSEDEDPEDKLVQKHVAVKPVDKKSDKSKSGIYKPPKLRSVAYTGDDDIHKANRGRRKTHDDFYRDDDDESGDIVEQSRRHRDAERTRFEEDNYTRLADENPRKTKRKLKTKEYRRKGRSNKFKRRKR